MISGDDMYVDVEIKENPPKIVWYKGHNPVLVGDPRVTMVYDKEAGEIDIKSIKLLFNYEYKFVKLISCFFLYIFFFHTFGLLLL